MGSRSILHFKHPITLSEVEEAAKFYAQERLGLPNSIFRDDKEQRITLKHNMHTRDMSNNDNMFICSFKIPHETILEHSHAETGNVPFRKGLFDYIGWKLGASYRTEDNNDTKQPLNTFLSHPFIAFNGIPDLSDTPIEHALHYLLGEKHFYFDEIYDIAPMNKLCQFPYPYIENAKYSRQKQFNFKLNKTMIAMAKKIQNSPYNVDYLYGDVMRAAIIQSNLKIVEEMLKRNFLLADFIDLSLIPHPSYISNKYLREISLPILCLMIQCLSSESFGPNYPKVIRMMIRRGANPYSRDYLGRDSLDYLLNTSHLLKKHKILVFNEIAKYFTIGDVKERIEFSAMTDKQKEFYLMEAQYLDLEKANYPIPPKPANIGRKDKSVKKWKQLDLFE